MCKRWMVRRHNISVYVVNDNPIRDDGRNERDETFKYTILNNGAYYVHHDWYKNHKLRGKVADICPQYVQDGCGFKLIIHTFI